MASNKVRNYKTCVICNKGFPCPPSDKTVTCSKSCSRIHLANKHRGRKLTEETKQKISAKAKEQGYTDNLRKGTPAAQQNPKSGRFETNINAIDWVLRSPEGKIYKCRNLSLWCRENYGLFGFDRREAYKAEKGLRTAKRGEEGKIKTNTYKGWRVILEPTDQE